MLKHMQCATLMLALFLVGCGDGASLAPESSGGGDGTGGGGGGVSTTQSVTVELFSCDSFDFSNPDVTAVGADSQPLCHGTTKIEDKMVTVVRVQATDNGAGVANGEVTLTPTDATLSTSSLLTQPDGYGYARLETTATSGLVKVTASYSGEESTVVASLPVRTLALSLFSCDSFDLSAPDLTGCSITTDVHDSSVTVIRAQALADGAGMQGQIVTITNTKGTLSERDGTVLTDSNGFAYMTLTAGSATGVAEIVATYKGATESQIVEMKGEGTTPSSQTVLQLGVWSCSDAFDIDNPSLALLNSECSPTYDVYDSPLTVLTARAVKNGIPLANEKITIATDKGLLSTADGSVLTDTDGYGYLSIAAAEDTGVVTISAEASGAESVETAARIWGQPVVSTKEIEIELWDCMPDQVGCSQISNFSSAASALIRVRALNDLRPAVEKKVTISADKGVLSPSDGVVLTDSNGYGYINISAGEDSGVVTLNANFDGAKDELFATINQVELELVLSSPLAADEELADGSTLAVTATLTTSDGSVYDTPAEVLFSSSCASAGTAEIDSSILSSNGVAIATYKPTGCQSTDTITASVTQGASSDLDTLVVNIAETEVGNIEFDAAEPEFITLKGTGGTTVSTITFIVKDQSGLPKQGVDVEFGLASGESFVELNTRFARSNSEGKVTVTATSGNLPGAYRVQAEVVEPIGDADLDESSVFGTHYTRTGIMTVSSNLTVATGLPDSDSFSLSFSNFNPDAADKDGVTVDVTIRAADHFNNPVKDGTTVYFSTEGGSIEPECQTSGGVCTVKWTSQNPRPADLRVAVLARAEGEEAFIDVNGDGLYQHDVDSFIASLFDLGEAFWDQAENGEHDANDQLFDRNESGQSGGVPYDAADGIYNGQLCSQASEDAGQCTQSLIDVHTQSVIVFSGNAPAVNFCGIGADGGIDCTRRITSTTRQTLFACVKDHAPDGTLNPVPAGSPITFSILGESDMKLTGKTSYSQPSTNAAIYHQKDATDNFVDVNGVGIDHRVSCGVGQYAVGVDVSEGYGSAQIEVETPEQGKYVASSVSVISEAAMANMLALTILEDSNGDGVLDNTEYTAGQANFTVTVSGLELASLGYKEGDIIRVDDDPDNDMVLDAADLRGDIEFEYSMPAEDGTQNVEIDFVIVDSVEIEGEEPETLARYTRTTSLTLNAVP